MNSGKGRGLILLSRDRLYDLVESITHWAVSSLSKGAGSLPRFLYMIMRRQSVEARPFVGSSSASEPEGSTLVSLSFCHTALESGLSVHPSDTPGSLLPTILVTWSADALSDSKSYARC